MSLLNDLFGGANGRRFYVRDFKNAYKFRPDVNPVRQKFQGYVNFIFNRELYTDLYSGGDNSKEFRTAISSLVRTADLPAVSFRTEVKNSYNRKKIVQTGLDFEPVNITVYDTVGNEWLSVLMKYFSYHYMNPRNKQDVGSRDIDSKIIRNGQNTVAGSNFGPSEVWDSNTAGYNPQVTANFFERIDYVLYHGNKGVQYSIINPVLTSFTPSGIDYSDSNFREFQMQFQYENFTTYNVTNFELTEEDVDRFEWAAEFGGPAFAPVENMDSLTERQMSVLGNTVINPTERTRSAQPQVIETATEQADNEDTQDPDNPGAGETDPETSETDPQEVTEEMESSDPDLPQVYGNSGIFANGSAVAGAGNESLGFGDILLDIADTSIATLINGGDVKSAALGAFVGGATRFVSQEVNSYRAAQEISADSPNQSDDIPASAPSRGGD